MFGSGKRAGKIEVPSRASSFGIIAQPIMEQLSGNADKAESGTVHVIEANSEAEEYKLQ